MKMGLEEFPEAPARNFLRQLALPFRGPNKPRAAPLAFRR